MLCCGVPTSRSPGDADWYSHCLSCRRTYLQPIADGFKYFKAECPTACPPKGSVTKSLAHPYYRIPVDATYFTCEQCFREFLIEKEDVDELSGQTVYKGRMAEQVYCKVLENIKHTKNAINDAKEAKEEVKQDLKMKMAHLLVDTKKAEQAKAELETALGKAKEHVGNGEKLAQLEKTNAELKRKIEMLHRLKEIRKMAPEITLPLMEIANIKKEISRIQPLEEAEQKKNTEMELEYLEKKEEFETVTARHETIAKQHMKLEKTKNVCDKANNEYDRLEEKRNTKLEEARIKFEADKTDLDNKNGELKKILEISAVKVHDLLDKINDLQAAQERQRQVPLFQLLQITNLDADNILKDLKKRAEILRDTLQPTAAADGSVEAVKETVETQETNEQVEVMADSLDFSVPLLPSSGSSHVEESLSEATHSEAPEDEEFYDTSSEDSFELIQKSSRSESEESEAESTVESDSETILFD